MTVGVVEDFQLILKDNGRRRLSTQLIVRRYHRNILSFLKVRIRKVKVEERTSGVDIRPARTIGRNLTGRNSQEGASIRKSGD